MGVGYHPPMPVYLDDQELALPATSLGALLDAARARAADAGRVVVEVQVDGKVLSADKLDEQRDTSISESEVHLVSIDPAQLGVDALAEARTQLAALSDLQQEAAELLQSDQAGEALAKLGGAIQGWINIAQAVTQTSQLNGVNLDALQVAGEPASAVVASLADQLRSVKGLIETQDTTALADAVGYEWPQVVTRWDALLETLAAKLLS